MWIAVVDRHPQRVVDDVDTHRERRLSVQHGVGDQLAHEERHDRRLCRAAEFVEPQRNEFPRERCTGQVTRENSADVDT
jgi:hypothetical protein